MPPKKSKAAKQDTSLPLVNGAGATVPPELLLEIIQEAASPPANYKGKINYRSRALGTMCRVNKHWKAISQVSLYRCLSFLDKPEQMAKLRRTVVGSPVIAGLITELVVDVVGEQQMPTNPTAFTKARARRQKAGKDLWDILEVLTGLKTLKVGRYQDLPKSYLERLQSSTRISNLSTVRSFDVSWSDPKIIAIMFKSMTSLEELSAFSTPSNNTDFRLFEIPVPLTRLSFAANCGRYGQNNWDDWLAIVKCSKDTLHTLELDDMEEIPPATLEAGLGMVSHSLRRLFYGSRIPALEAVLLAALPTFKNLISLRTSLPTTSVLDAIPSTIIELGMAHQSRYYEEVQDNELILRTVLKRARDVPNLKILWLPGKLIFMPTDEDTKHLKLLREKAVAQGMTWKILTCPRGMLPLYGSKDEAPYISHLRLIPGVYIARAHTGTGKVFDVAEYTRITEK